MNRQFEITSYPATLGAEVHGIDLGKPLTGPVRDALVAAWAEHLVLVFRNQALSDDALVRFAECLGELDPPGPNPYSAEPLPPTHPVLNVISNIVENGRPLGNLGDGEAVWHADMTYQDLPPKGAILAAVELPPKGGNTYFADMFAAYDALPEALRDAVESKVAIHDASHNSAGFLRRGYEQVTDVRQTPGARHPLVRTAPLTGRRCLFLGRRPRSYVVGMPVEESEALLDALWSHATEPRFTLGHVWQSGDVVMWDNLGVLHRRDAFDSNARRKLHRAQIKGSEVIT